VPGKPGTDYQPGSPTGEPSQQGTLTVLNRQTSFGTFGGGDGGSGSPGGKGAGKSVVWSTRRTDSDAASKSVNTAMAAAPAKITCATWRRWRVVIPVPCGSLLAAGRALLTDLL
jgi:hypothetical protein